MADVILLRPSARTARSPAPEGGAQILFFLGVRYCRVENPALYEDSTQKPRGSEERGKKRRRRARA